MLCSRCTIRITALTMWYLLLLSMILSLQVDLWFSILFFFSDPFGGIWFGAISNSSSLWTVASSPPSDSLSLLKKKKKITELGTPGWLSQLRIQLRLRSWFCISQVWAPHPALCWHLKSWNLLRLLCFVSLSAPPLTFCVSVSLRNK